MKAALFAFMLDAILLSGPAQASLTQAELATTGFAPSPGAAIPADLAFLDDAGRHTTLGAALHGRPALLLFVDPACRELCGPMLSIVASTAARMPLVPGDDYTLAAVSLDPDATPADARRMKDERLGDTQLGRQTRILVGDAKTLAPLSDAVGYHAAYDAEVGLFAHAASLAVLTGDGHVSRILPALSLDPDMVRLALVEAGEGRIGSLRDRLHVLCYGLDPATGRFNDVAHIALVAGAVLTLGAIGVLIQATRRRAIERPA